jgi:uncharacterized membrane protein
MMMELMMLLMMGSWLIVPLILIGAAAFAIGRRPQLNHSVPAKTSPTPLEILKARYAHGEINREEYDQVLRELEG